MLAVRYPAWVVMKATSQTTEVLRRPRWLGRPVERGTADTGTAYSRGELRALLADAVARFANKICATLTADGEKVWVDFNDVEEQGLTWTSCARRLSDGTRVQVCDGEGNHADAVVLGTLTQCQ